MVVTRRRNTSQRTEISRALGETDEFISAQDLHAAMRAAGSTIGLATVYRTVQDLAGTGELDTVRTDAGEVLYRRCAQPVHHHHLVCRNCGRTEEVEAPAIEAWARAVAEEHGYVDIDHQVELFGLCADCASAR